MVPKSITLDQIKSYHREIYNYNIQKLDSSNFITYYLESISNGKWYCRDYFLPPTFQRDPRDKIKMPLTELYSRVVIEFDDNFYWLLNNELGIKQHDTLHPGVSEEDMMLIKLAAQYD